MKSVIPLCLLAAGTLRLMAQAPPMTVLEIDVDNVVAYVDDLADPAKKATVPGISPMPSNVTRIMKWAIAIGDIVAVNGKPAKGLYTFRFGPGIMATTTLTPARSIADLGSGCPAEAHFTILQPDGSLVGSIEASGSNGAPPPGAPASATSTLLAVVGGTGPFLGARGQLSRATDTARTASMIEDPAYRRVNGGGKRREIIQLLPMTRPEVVVTSAGPAVFHSDDFSAVTMAKPARAGEVLILTVTGLGPTRPVVDAGQPFPAYREGNLHVVTSPVSVTVNGEAAEIQNAFGWPEMTDAYRVDARVPQGTAAGMATVRVSAAWVAGCEVKVPVR